MDTAWAAGTVRSVTTASTAKVLSSDQIARFAVLLTRGRLARAVGAPSASSTVEMLDENPTPAESHQ